MKYLCKLTFIQYILLSLYIHSLLLAFFNFHLTVETSYFTLYFILIRTMSYQYTLLVMALFYVEYSVVFVTRHCFVIYLFSLFTRIMIIVLIKMTNNLFKLILMKEFASKQFVEKWHVTETVLYTLLVMVDWFPPLSIKSRMWLVMLSIPRRVRGHSRWCLLFSSTYSYTWVSRVFVLSWV